jgi:DNA topoisomerase I
VAHYFQPVASVAVSPLADVLVEVNDPLAAARAAGLRHVDDSQPGLRRRRTGKKLRQGNRWAEQFQILDADGRVVHDRDQLDRIRRLAIPPAWNDVWICPHAAGHIQATGRDARGRKQYRYHPRWREHRDQTKYEKMIAFARALPAIRSRVAADLQAPGLRRSKVLATVVRLLETTFIRVGNEEYARANRSFGLTTLKDRHVSFGGAELRFHFRGKSGVFHEISIRDAAIARIVRRCRDLPGQELFQYLDENGQPATIDSADVNEYIRDIAGGEFTAKDFRTWAGTVLAATALCAMCARAGDAAKESARVAARARARLRRDPAPSKRDVVRAIEQVARRLGNTPSVCRKSYVHPEVIGAFLDGSLGRDAAFARVLARAPAAALTNARVLALPARSDRALRPEEVAVLALLKRREAEARRGNRLEAQLRRSLHAVATRRLPVAARRSRGNRRRSFKHRAAPRAPGAPSSSK